MNSCNMKWFFLVTSVLMAVVVLGGISMFAPFVAAARIAGCVAMLGFIFCFWKSRSCCCKHDDSTGGN